jgi:hypothetical protein
LGERPHTLVRKKETKVTDIVNLILHGVYGYILRKDFVEAYTPAVHGHIYGVGGLDYKNAKPLKRVTYNLRGVAGDPNEIFKPDPSTCPVLPLPKIGPVDPFGKRYCMFRFPYPRKISGYTKQLYALDAYEVGNIYAGRDSTALNNMDSCPSMLIIVYERSDKFLRLDPDDGSVGIDLSDLLPNPGTSIVNLHVWCTINPADMTMCGMTHEGHIRKAFASLVDLVPSLEVTLQIPDRFSPAACEEDYPAGVGRCDVDPGRKNCSRLEFGKINCHYANLIFQPAE